MKKLTEKEIIQAFKQMKKDRNKDYRKAQKAAKDLEKALGIENCCDVDTPYGYSFEDASPYKIQYVLKLIFQKYGPDIKDFVNKLDKMPNVKKSSGVIGFSIHYPTYEINAPQGIYKIAFQYFDNYG